MLKNFDIKDYLHYNPTCGNFFYSNKLGNSRVVVGCIAGSYQKSSGYRIIKFNREYYKAHRLAWFFTHGVWPTMIDHINGNKLDNRIENLREVTPRENNQNYAIHRNGKLQGTFKVKKSGRWVAQAAQQKNGVRVNNFLGTFQYEEEAHLTYLMFVEYINEKY